MNNLLNKINRYLPIYLRVALGVAFLSAVADRFGLWGAPGSPGVAWGNFQNFLDSTATLNPYLTASLIPAFGWFVTGAELTLGLALIAGYRMRITALLSGFLLLAFALGLTIGAGIKAPLDASVFSASAGAFLLAAWHQNKDKMAAFGDVS